MPDTETRQSDNDPETVEKPHGRGFSPSPDRGRVTFLDPKNMTDEEIEDALAFINEGMPES